MAHTQGSREEELRDAEFEFPRFRRTQAPRSPSRLPNRRKLSNAGSLEREGGRPAGHSVGRSPSPSNSICSIFFRLA